MYHGATWLRSTPIRSKKNLFIISCPESTALTFGMLGCDFHCGYCQNWLTSQVLRDPAADEFGRFHQTNFSGANCGGGTPHRCGSDCLIL